MSGHTCQVCGCEVDCKVSDVFRQLAGRCDAAEQERDHAQADAATAWDIARAKDEANDRARTQIDLLRIRIAELEAGK